jgi:branched-chain amino acid transport system permease protein
VSGGAADLAVAGLGTGAVAALSGLGVLATYRVTGVLNVAFGAVGMFAAYLTRALVVDAHLPEFAAGLLVVCCLAPLFGLGLEAAVFGPLQTRAADAARLLTAGFGVTVLLVGVATAIWGAQARTDAPMLLPGGTSRIAGVDVPAAVPIELALVLLVALALGWFSRGGPAVRAVIDDRRLAELAGLPARRLARIGWVAGTVLAALTGVLLAPQLRFDPTTLTLVLFETLGVAVAARLRSAPIAILAAFATAIAQSELTGVHLTGAAGSMLDAVRSNLFVLLLLGATWLTPAFDAPTAARRPLRLAAGWPPYLLVLGLGVAGWVLRPTDLRAALTVPALALVLLSFRVLSSAGMLSLGQAGLAGIGALTAGWAASGWGLPGALLAGAAVAAAFALPVLRQAGLHLAVATLAAATALSSFLFDQPLFTPSSVRRPGFAEGDKAYFAFELLVLIAVLAALTVLVRGPVALRLSALRDSETAARTAGIAVDAQRLAVFAAAGAVAALGGALWAAGDQVFDANSFEPAQGLLWFAAAAAVGFVDSAALILAAMVLVVADTFVAGAAAVLVGAATLVLPALRWEPGSAAWAPDRWRGRGDDRKHGGGNGDRKGGGGNGGGEVARLVSGDGV